MYEEFHCGKGLVTRIVEKAHEDRRGANVVMLSGGGSYGAWGAGFIDGWWEGSGKDVELDLITGVSAGSFVSVYVYLQDTESLYHKFQQISSDDFYKKRFPLFVPFSSSIHKTRRTQEKNLMPKLFPNEVINRVAAKSEDRNAPLLCVGSTRLATGEFIKWDMVKVAKAKKYDLFRSIMRSAIAFPIMFEPVKIGDELFVDGGLRHDIFVDLTHITVQRLATFEKNNDPILKNVPQNLLDGFSVESIADFRNLSELAQIAQLAFIDAILNSVDFEPYESNAYIVINGKTSLPNYEIKSNMLSLAKQTMGIMVKQSLYGSLYEIYYDLSAHSLQEHWDFYYTQAPENFPCDFTDFDPERCTDPLFVTGREAGKARTFIPECEVKEPEDPEDYHSPWCPEFPDLGTD